jgi:hypothetical protein
MGGKMKHFGLTSLTEAAQSLEISISLVNKFINLGLVNTVKDGNFKMLTPYGFRRLSRVIDLYEKSYSPDSIEAALNH